MNKSYFLCKNKHSNSKQMQVVIIEHENYAASQEDDVFTRCEEYIKAHLNLEVAQILEFAGEFQERKTTLYLPKVPEAPKMETESSPLPPIDDLVGQAELEGNFEDEYPYYDEYDNGWEWSAS